MHSNVSDPTRLPAGSRLGNYIIQCPIGQGGFGVVYRAHHAHWPERLVAIKVPRDEASAGTLLRAGASQGRIEHPGVVKVLDVDPGKSGSFPHLVLEWVDGETLAQRIGRGGPLPEQMAATILDRIADAIETVHRGGTCHGDLKPSNVILGLDGRVALTDFGACPAMSDIKRNMEWSIGSVDLATAVGTLGYLAPEQREGHIPDAAGDLYSLGVILFEMLTGRLPALSDRLLDPAADALYRDLCAPAARRLSSVAELRARLRAMGADSQPSPPQTSAAFTPPMAQAFLPAQPAASGGGFCPDEFKRDGVSAFVPAEFRKTPATSAPAGDAFVPRHIVEHKNRRGYEGGFHSIKINEGTSRLNRRAMWLFTLWLTFLSVATAGLAGTVGWMLYNGGSF